MPDVGLAWMGVTVESPSDRLTLTHSDPQTPTQLTPTGREDPEARADAHSLCTLAAGAVTFAVVYCKSLAALVSMMYF